MTRSWNPILEHMQAKLDIQLGNSCGNQILNRCKCILQFKSLGSIIFDRNEYFYSATARMH